MNTASYVFAFVLGGFLSIGCGDAGKDNERILPVNTDDTTSATDSPDSNTVDTALDSLDSDTVDTNTGVVHPLQLRTEGRDLINGRGEPVILRGVNQHGFVDVPDGAWDAPGEALYTGMGKWRKDVVQETLDSYKSNDFNVVRFHTIVDWWKTNPKTYSDPYRDVTYEKPYRDMILDVVQWAADREIYVIFDFYAMENKDGVQSGQESLPWPSWGRFPGVIADRSEFVSLWESVAQTLGGQPNVLFELYNEPHGDDVAEAEWFSFVDEVLPVIRAHSPNPVIVQWDYMCWVNLDYPPPQFAASTLEWIVRFPLTHTNIVYGTHLYRNSGGGFGMPHRSDGGLVNLYELADIENGLVMAQFPEARNEWQVPLVVTEIGAFLAGDETDQEHEVSWLRNTLSVLNDWEVGYVGWAWRSDEQLDHGMLHDGVPNAAGKAFLQSLQDGVEP